LVEERFEFEGLSVAVYRAGQGEPLLMLHGSGPGASSLGNWSRVLEPLAQRYEVWAMDLVGFGKSERREKAPYFDFEQWVRQAHALVNYCGRSHVGVIAHSLSAAIALRLAGEDARIAAVMTTGAMGLPFTATDETRRTWRCPRNREELVRAISGLVSDMSLIDERYLLARESVIYAPGYQEYFDEMFEGDPERYIEAASLDNRQIAAIAQPVLLLHGLNDRGFPAATSIELAKRLSNAELMLLQHCSHSVAAERSSTFLAVAQDFFDRALNSK
jgi:2-hydroxymuconate-semialdehyde hydrolase